MPCRHSQGQGSRPALNHPVLFGAEPIGRARGDVESLSGFFARLCLARFLYATSVWCRYFLHRCTEGVFPATPRPVGAFLGRSSGALDILPESALAFASVLEDLTSLPNLRACTLASLAPYFHLPTGRRQDHLRKHWCPACLAHWEAEEVPYEPLVWRLALVARCPRHRLRLLNRCPTCERPQPVVTQGVPIGYCLHCAHALYRGADLSPPDEQSLDVTERWLLWRSVALSRLLAWSSSLPVGALSSLPVVNRFPRLLEHTLKYPPDSSLRTPLALACSLGINSTHFYPHLSGDLRPTLPYAIDTCMQLGIDPLFLVRGDYREGERSWPPPDDSRLDACSDPWRLALQARESSTHARLPARARALDAFIADPSATDLSGIVTELRASPSSLARSFPVRYPRARELRTTRLERDRQVTVRRFNHVLEHELASGSPRSLADIALSLGTRHAVLTSYCPERCEQLCRMREAMFSTHKPGIRESARDALRAALRVSDGPSVEDVARSLGVRSRAVQSLLPDEHRRLVDLRNTERAARRARYADAMRADLARSRPRGVAWLVADLRVPHPTLKRAGPDLYAKLSCLEAERSTGNRRSRVAATRARARAGAKARRLRLRRFTQALEKELRSDSPRSPRQVALDFGAEPKRLRAACPDLYRRLRELRPVVRARRLETLRRKFQAEIARPSPLSVWAFCRAHHTTTELVNASFPDLVCALRAAWRRAPRPIKPRPRAGDARLLAALEAEAKLDSPRPVTILAKSLGVSFSTLSRLSRPAVDRILAARRSR